MDFVEKRLTQRAKRGDREAFAELIEIYKDKIFQLAYRMVGNRQDAEDIAQETFCGSMPICTPTTRATSSPRGFTGLQPICVLTGAERKGLTFPWMKK